jgi:chromosome segregation ATPase
MNNKSAVVVLAALSILLGIGLYMRHINAVDQKKKDDASIATLEGTVKATEGKLTEQKQVNATLTTNLVAKTEEAKTLTAQVAATTAELGQTKESLAKSQGETKAAQAAIKVAQAETKQAQEATKQAQAETKAAQAETKQVETRLTAAMEDAKAKAKAEAEAAAKAAAARYAALDKSKQEEIAKRDASIKDLQDTRDQLNAKIAGLNADIVKLNSTIGTLNARITLVEGELQVAKDDKSFLTKELARMQGERTEMERKMNDLAFLREQISTIKSDQAIARRVDWMRRGTFMDERKLATVLNDGLKPLPSTKPSSTRGSQLNVEVHRDGTVTIKPPTAPAPKPESGVEKSVTVGGPDFPATPKKK